VQNNPPVIVTTMFFVLILMYCHCLLAGGVQIQLRDKKTSYHFGHLDNRDVVYALLHLMLSKVERNFSSEAALVDLGYIAVEVLLQIFLSIFFLSNFYLFCSTRFPAFRTSMRTRDTLCSRVILPQGYSRLTLAGLGAPKRENTSKRFTFISFFRNSKFFS